METDCESKYVMWWKSLHILHSWTMWEQYKERGKMYVGRLAPKSIQGRLLEYEDLRQRRTCKYCKKVQDIIIKEM